ncbi:MAG TPA: NYN domain-containing protein [Elusimicrobia bacterium]|nr:NYN domain-containing protein [Elusimicrobiota bacterium]
MGRDKTLPIFYYGGKTMRAMIFIDGGYFFSALRDRFERPTPDIKYQELAEKELLKNDTLIRIYYYNALPPVYSDQEKYNKIQKLLWQISLKKPSQKTEEEIKAEEQFRKDNKQMNFYDSLRYRGIEVKLVKLKRDPDLPGRYKQKGVDIYLASDMLSLAYKNAYDIAVLISGDVDYVKVVEEIKSLGKIVAVASFKYGRSDDLIKSCDRHIRLDDIIDNYVIRK